MGMVLNLDMSSQIRSLGRLRDVVIAIRDAPASTQETVALEWKSTADLAEKRWQAEAAKQVLAFANRDPEVAAKHFGGCAYVLFGVNPGALLGTPKHDAAKIEAWLSPYIGRAPNAPEWAPDFVEIDGNAVLILTIEPPQFGHPMWTCQKSYAPDPRKPGGDPKMAVREHAIYVRHKASTEEATGADIEMLSRRLVGKRQRIAGISIVLSPESKAQPLDATEEAVQAWIAKEREAVAPPSPPEPEPRTRTVRVDDLDPNSSLARTAKMIAELSESALTKGWYEPDIRTREQYQAEVDAYIEKAAKALPLVLLRRAHQRKLGCLALSIRNDTDDPIQKLQLEVFIGADGIFAATEYGEVPATEMPARPVMLGKGGRSTFADFGLSAIGVPDYRRYVSPAIQGIGPRGVSIDNSGSTRLTFYDIDLYPQEVSELDEVYLYANAGLHAGKTLTAEWTARARNLSGVMRGTFEIPVDGASPSVEELLAEPRQPAEDDDSEDS